jgi:hypothetical protein
LAPGGSPVTLPIVPPGLTLSEQPLDRPRHGVRDRIHPHPLEVALVIECDDVDDVQLRRLGLPFTAHAGDHLRAARGRRVDGRPTNATQGAGDEDDVSCSGHHGFVDELPAGQRDERERRCVDEVERWR